MEDGSPKSDQISLRDYVESKLRAERRITDARFESIQVASDKAERMLQVRLEALNEWRAQNAEERETFATLDKLDAVSQVFKAEMDAERTRDDLVAAQMNDIRGQVRVLLGIIGVFLTIELFTIGLLVTLLTHR